MNDAIVEAIQSGQLNNSNISFGELRRIAGRNNDQIYRTLDRGRAILTSSEQLDQYLYSYGPMIEAQWSTFLKSVSLPNGRISLFDYGCGQGLGAALLLDYVGSSLSERIEHATLIEPSAVALNRAESVLGCYIGPQRIFSINKDLDSLKREDIPRIDAIPRIHILSNILDIDGFNHEELFSKIFSTTGKHSVLAVSNDRNFYGGTKRFEQLDSEIKDPKHKHWLSVQSSIIAKFSCGTNKSAISWELHAEVLSEPV